jgi:hypothetical protein
MENITLDGVEYKMDDLDNEQKIILHGVINNYKGEQDAMKKAEDSAVLKNYYIQKLKDNIASKKKNDDPK